MKVSVQFYRAAIVASAFFLLSSYDDVGRKRVAAGRPAGVAPADAWLVGGGGGGDE